MKHKAFNTKHNKQQESHFLLSVFHVSRFVFHEKGMAMLATVLILMLIMVAVGLSIIPSDPSDCSLYDSAACVKVIVEKDSASVCSQSISAGQDCLISLGTLGNSARKVEVILNVNATSGKMIMQSWQEK